MKRHRCLAITTATALLSATFPMTVLADTWDLVNGAITVTADTEGQTVSQNETSKVDPSPVITSNNLETSNSLTIKATEQAIANVTLNNVNIDCSTPYQTAVKTEGPGTVTIELDGTNTVKSHGYGHAGIHKSNDGKLIIQNENNTAGSLTAQGDIAAAGIGGGYQEAGNGITITGGTVTAIGGDAGAGIGGGNGGGASNITIEGGNVTATGYLGAAGIGGGNSGNGSNITISGGTVNATGNNQGAGIGGGLMGDGSNITITGGEINATGGWGAAGIGGGYQNNGNHIIIEGGTVTATGGNEGAGIGGGGYGGNGSNITIEGGTVTATGNSGAAGIGGGNGGAHPGGNGSNITISGGRVTATGNNQGAGIGGGLKGNGSNITITGGEINATGGWGAAGIGGGYCGDNTGGTGSDIKITSGTVTATGGGAGAGIGGGGNGTGNHISIQGGTVTAAGQAGGAAVGGGANGTGSNITYNNGQPTEENGKLIFTPNTTNHTPQEETTLPPGESAEQVAHTIISSGVEFAPTENSDTPPTPTMIQRTVKELCKDINHAPANGVVAYDTGDLFTLTDDMLYTIAQRNDLTIVISFRYMGVNYQITIPAGLDYTRFFEDNTTFYGYLYFAQCVGATVVAK